MNFSPVWTDMSGVSVQPRIEQHPTFERLMARIPASERESFTPVQLALLSSASKPPPPQHWIDFRVSLPFFGTRFYVTLLSGKERRSIRRIKSEGQISASNLSVAYLGALLLIGTVSFLAIAVFLYVLKSGLGIDFYEDHSFLHGLLLE